MTVIVTVAVSVPPFPSLTVYSTVVSWVSPIASDSNSPLGSKLIEPSALIVKRPPLEPAKETPTLPPVTPVILKVSVASISLSAPLPLLLKTLPLYTVSSSIVTASS